MLLEIENYIAAHLEVNITSIDVAHHLYLNPSYFSRSFKRLTGETFTNYVHRYKTRIASEMLKSMGDSVDDIALKLGYPNRAYFAKVFKKYTGVTPGQYKWQPNHCILKQEE